MKISQYYKTIIELIFNNTIAQLPLPSGHTVVSLHAPRSLVRLCSNPKPMDLI